MCLDVLHPVPHIVERRLVVHGIHQENAHGSTVVCCGEEPMRAVNWAGPDARTRKHHMHQAHITTAATMGCAPLVIVLKRSCPAVSHICSLIHLLSKRIFLILKSILRQRSNRCERHKLQIRPLACAYRYLLQLCFNSPNSSDEARCEGVFGKSEE